MRRKTTKQPIAPKGNPTEPPTGPTPRGVKQESSAKSRVDFRLDREHKALIERAAAYRGETVSGYAISTLVREAQRVVREHEITTLSDTDRDRFLELLAQPAEATDASKRAARRHRDLITRSG